jgi:probable rRNA maturation factor
VGVPTGLGRSGPSHGQGVTANGAPPGAHSLSIGVEVSDTQEHVAVDPEFLARLARRVLAGAGVAAGSVSIALVDDATIRALNRRHLAHDWPTDVLSFRLSDAADPCLAGEIVVSGERAAALAREFSLDQQSELALYVVHGLLHLCGHDDRTASDAEAMRRQENEILATEGLTNTFPLAGTSEGGERESVRWAD